MMCSAVDDCVTCVIVSRSCRSSQSLTAISSFPYAASCIGTEMTPTFVLMSDPPLPATLAERPRSKAPSLPCTLCGVDGHRTPDGTAYLPLREAAQQLGVSRDTLRR